MIGIGINEFVVVGKETKVNDKNTVELQLKAAGANTSDAIALMLEGKTQSEGSTKLLIFPVFKTDKGSRLSNSTLITKLQDYQKVFANILSIYLTEEQIKEHFGFGIMLGVCKSTDPDGINKEFEAGLKSDEFVDKICAYIGNKFISVMTKFDLFESTESFRIKLWRQSPTKNFPCLPNKYNTWIESMKVPSHLSKLAPSKYEKDNNKLSTAPAAADVVPPQEEEKATNLFESPAEKNPSALDGFPFTDSKKK